MKKTLFLLPVLLLCIPVQAVAEEEFTLPEKEMQKFSAAMKDLFDGWVADDRAKAFDAKNALAALIEATEKEKGVDDLLRYTDFWYKIREGAIDTSNKLLRKTATGKGFKDEEFTDYTDSPPKDYQYLMSVPKDYDHEGTARFPVIIFLHPEITARGKKLEREAPKMLKSLYDDDELLDQYIIIAPLGPMGGRKGKDLIDAGKDWEDLDGLKTAFVAIRIMMEQMVFDRERVYLDGMGRAGLSACRFATWYPSYFAGVVCRDAPLEPIVTENVVDIPFLYVSSPENTEENLKEAKAWAEKYHAEGGEEGKEKTLRFKLIEDTPTEEENKPSLTEPTMPTRTSIREWLGTLKKGSAPKEIFIKTADLAKADAYWLHIEDLNAGLDMKLDDPNYPWIKAKIDSDSNSIVLESKRVLKVFLYLNDKLLDLDKKVSVIFNGKKRFEGKVERNLDKMLNLAFGKGWYEIYVNWLEISEEG